MPIPRLVIDSTAAPTLLCLLGHETRTDKSPYNVVGHRHPYTPVYSLLFGHLRGRPVRFAEIGLAMGASAEMWCKYFEHPDALILGFDRDQGINRVVEGRVEDSRLRTGLMDVSVDGAVRAALEGAAAAGSCDASYDVIIDDSSHTHEHQIRIIREALPFVKSGGMLIIEDIFRSTAEEEYERLIGPEIAACSEVFFVDCEHKNKWSPGWDNDRLLVLIKA
jgi:demethylmacrocin O-methyltransferase